MRQLIRASGLSDSQAGSGLTALRDEAASKGWPPLIWTRADGYQLGAERAALEAYERAVVREKLTQFRRFITGTLAPHAAAHPNDKWVKHIVAQLSSIESTLDLIASA
ncbi:RacP protein [Streptomyces sp. NPDC048210]|uniref:RacP protein n=1 Tax=Streptomyces sp. NPDC048210 TaxID=3156657 RepID=UPI00343E6166